MLWHASLMTYQLLDSITIIIKSHIMEYDRLQTNTHALFDKNVSISVH